VVKFLSGTSYDGSQVPACTYWRTDVETDTEVDFAELTDPPGSQGSCIANHYFPRDEISCFNDGQCNSEGKCLPCTKYKYGDGVRMGISHSPPKAFFNNFIKGLTDSDLLSPQLGAAGVPVNTVAKDQLPFHILLRNIQAEIAKCCRWNAGNGTPTEFLITAIVDGPDKIEITDANGGTFEIKGIRVKNSAFPEDQGTTTNPEGGSFFPVGLTVVAGWADAPSFYLEPRTGLVKPGEGVVFKSAEDGSTVNSQAKAIAPIVPGSTVNALSVIDYCLAQAAGIANAQVDFFNNILQSSAPDGDKQSAQDKMNAAIASYQAVVDAKAAAIPLAASSNAAAAQITAATTQEALNSASTTCSEQLELLALQVDIANQNCGGEPAADAASGVSRQLRIVGQSLLFAGRGGSTKCELAFTDNNSAAQWNTPIDGSLPCNGMRSDCTFYTGPEWKHATTENLEVGKKITAEAVQEVRFYSDDWSRYQDPETEFNNRFSVPFIWAFKDFQTIGGTPDPADMLLYRPNTMFAREPFTPGFEGDNPNTLSNAYDVMRIEKVKISNFRTLDFQNTVSRVLPGSRSGETANSDSSVPFADKIAKFNVPSATRLKITHPPEGDDPFIYRSWSPEFTNRISLFGSAAPGQAIYIVNNTALQNRDRYNTFFDSTNMFDLPSGGLPGASSNFTNTSPAQLLKIFNEMSKEKAANQSPAVLGFDLVSSSTTGFWESRVEVDLVQNAINDIYAFILIDSVLKIFSKTQVDCRVLHSIMKQDSFISTDFTMHDVGGKTQLGIANGNLQKSATLRASPTQILGNEAVSLSYGYYAWRFKDRGLRFSTLNAGSDLTSGNASTSGDDTSYVTESDASAFITNVTYRVVQYRETETIQNWYLLQDCGLIMAAISSPNANRVLPLVDQSGAYKALTPVLVNNGATGSVVAQWAPEVVTLNIDGSDKNLILLYRNVDGLGLPANYAIYGPAPGAANLFGRPDPDRDTLNIQYTYLRAQTHQKAGSPSTSPEGSGEVVNNNFYGDRLRSHNQQITITDAGIVSGSASDRSSTIGFDQQDFVTVHADSEGRPLGKKNVRFMVAYYNLACVSIEIFYAWRSDCVTYGLFPDLFLATGGSNGQVTVAPKASINPSDLTLGSRVKNLLGPSHCSRIPSCGDHEVLRLGPVRKEFEVIVSTGQEGQQKAFFPSAGQAIGGPIVLAEPPGTQYQLKRGTLWYPYNVCERPRYKVSMDGPGGESSTELINQTTSNAGVSSGQFGSGTFEPGPGSQGDLAAQVDETHHVYDEVTPKILDIHATLKACLSGYTYGNTVSLGGGTFTGYARARGEIDQFWYESANWAPPPFGNFGRPVLMCEITTKIGDYQVKFEQIGFRFMPMFPQREDMGATSGIFGEELEPVGLRLLCGSSPAGGISETAPQPGATGYTHQALITNRGGGGIEYPYAPYYPTFLPDSLLGKEPNAQGISQGSAAPRGTITTGWAWRYADQPVKRAQNNTKPIIGMKFILPGYALDNRRMEQRLRPPQTNYQVKYTAPTFDTQTGATIRNATIQLGNGPEREILIDFVGRKFGLPLMPDTVYDTSKLLGEAPFECSPGPSTNLQLANNCSCAGTVETESPQTLPAVFLHGDSLAPGAYAVLYSTSTMGPAFPTDIGRATIQDPCCMCNYYLEQIYFTLDSSVLPITPGINPVGVSSVLVNYTWSRVPHGTERRTGQDDLFSSYENRAQNYVTSQGVLRQAVPASQRSVVKTNVTAYFPSTVEAGLEDIVVHSFNDDSDPKLLGGKPALNNTSQGEDEQITLDMTMSAYTSITSIRIWFIAGKDMQVPEVFLTGIPPQFRTGDFVTTRTGAVLATSNSTAIGTSVPNPDNIYSSEDIQNGEVLFEVLLTPAYGNRPFWDRFYQEFHLIFKQRDTAHSMGIHAIEITADVLVGSVVETIYIPERRYYRSTMTPAGGTNPEENLTGMDSATAYWRTTSEFPESGGNRYRAYSWGRKANQESGVGQGGGQPIIQQPIGDLEALQQEEYDKARSLFQSPYTYTYTGFYPLDEQRWINFLGGSMSSWSTTVSTKVSDIDKISTESAGEDRPLYGSVPSRTTWAAPGHAWTHRFEEEYNACCEGCGQTQLIGYNFAHLHDGLAEVEQAGFWADLSKGPSFAGIAAATPSILAQPDVVHLTKGDLLDQDGNPIPSAVLDASGIRKDGDTGALLFTNYSTTEGTTGNV
jgi:hypothetical protein